MKTTVYDFNKDRSSAIKQFLKCQVIVDDNHIENGGTLIKNDLLTKNYQWRYLVTVEIEGQTVGFAITRVSYEDKHNTGLKAYNYLSQIAVLKKAQKLGIGTELLNTILELTKGEPLVASSLKNNESSNRLLKKGMTKYAQTKNYYRYIDNQTLGLVRELRTKKI